ncbi:MAG: Lrp/AsnC ligand binding domain-containing protein [Candidatus Bathyarchaeota archaeon]|nr:Lrp/AsnC ligand binding domain-containing protein [Candidatus Bathyarchaeota archaeon]
MVKTETGMAGEVIKNLRAMPEVKRVYQVYGDYDIVARIETDDVEHIKETLSEKVKQLEYVNSTLTLLVREAPTESLE